MLSTLLKIGPITLHSYGLMIAIGFLVALHFIQKEAKANGIDPDAVSTAAFWSLFIGVAGTRVMHIAMFPQEYSLSDPIGWIAIQRGGLVFQGGPPPVLIFLYFYLKKKGVPFWKFVDIATTYLPLGHAIGRVGCFLHGCCYGRISSVPWAIQFPRHPFDATQDADGSPAYLDHLASRLVTFEDQWSLPVHPTQLYSFVLLVVLCLVLRFMKTKWHPFDGFVLPIYLILYGVIRFVTEFYRGDHNPTMFHDFLSTQQVFSVVAILLGLCLYQILRLRSRGKS